MADSPTENCFTSFQESIDAFSLPERFTFPFYYEPHPLCRLAAKELQHHLKTQTDWEHDFGIDHEVEGTNIGKMFGVLLVENLSGEVGYLSAFSGKLAGENHHPKFVPPIFDALQKDGFYRIGEAELDGINFTIKKLEASSAYLETKELHQTESDEAACRLKLFKTEMKRAKKQRKERRQLAEKEMSVAQFDEFKEALKKESLKYQYDYKQLSRYWNERVEQSRKRLEGYSKEIEDLKLLRKQKSANLQQKLFDQYRFLNIKGIEKDLCDIFKSTDKTVPPGGAGDCAAPKLLQYAFQHGLRPLAMAEFWWGQSPKSEIRKHQGFYPSCRGKCEPILAHMLDGIEVDDNPVLSLQKEVTEIEVIFEDEAIAIINKPAEFLSVPGKQTQDSVYLRMKEKYPHATGPLIVHRLDMSTSGLMVVAKTKEVHENLQKQFLKKTVKKQYLALLDGILKANEGTIDLPLRVDLDNRPHQLVCYEYGKSAITKWKVIERKDKQTRIAFYPITGRTHQLRVHSAHPQGLNLPIVGDDLYGQKGKRLHLHAESIELIHPISNELVRFTVEPEF